MVRSEKLDSCFEKVLVVVLCGFSIMTFFAPMDKGPFYFFSIVSFAVLLAWRFIVGYKTTNPLPKFLLIVSLLFLLSVIISALLSENRHWAFIYLRQYRFIILGGLLFTAPLQDRSRKLIIVVFFFAAALAGLAGIAQQGGFMPMMSGRPEGFSGNANIYAGIMAIVCSTAVLMLFFPTMRVFSSRRGFYFLVIIAFLTFCGAILSESRSIWVALIIAPVITLFLYDRKKAVILFFALASLIAVALLSNTMLKQRALSIVTSAYTENETGAVGNRLQLWKGALLIFREQPFFGTGLGDFSSDIKQLIIEKKLKEISNTDHAHNIYLQALATRGITGLALLFAFFLSLIKWGLMRVRAGEKIGGYVIILIISLTMIGGITDNHAEVTMFLAASCLTIGLLGPYSEVNQSSQNCLTPEK